MSVWKAEVLGPDEPDSAPFLSKDNDDCIESFKDADSADFGSVARDKKVVLMPSSTTDVVLLDAKVVLVRMAFNRLIATVSISLGSSDVPPPSSVGLTRFVKLEYVAALRFLLRVASVLIDSSC